MDKLSSLHTERDREVLGMKVPAVLVCVCAVALAEVQFQHPEEWQLWQTQHKKSYGSQREELERHLVWLSNREYINAHNKNAHILGFTLAMNHLGDIVSTLYACIHVSKLSVKNNPIFLQLQTDAEYEQLLTYRTVDHGNYTNKPNVFSAAQYSSNLPETVDWRTKNAVTGIKNQVGSVKEL